MLTIRSAVPTLCVGALFSSIAAGAITLSIDETTVPQSSNVTLTLRADASAGEQVKSLTLNAQLNDGSTSPSNPVFTQVPTIAGTLFAGGDVTEASDAKIADFPSNPGFFFDIDTPFVPDGIIAFLHIDTSMLPDESTFTLDFDGDFPSNFNDSNGNSISLPNAGPFSFTVAVPEPATLAALFSLGGLTLLRRPRACN